VKYISFKALFFGCILITLMQSSMSGAQAFTPTTIASSKEANNDKDVVIVLGNKVQAHALKLWSMLSHIQSKKDADAKADLFLNATQKIAILDREYFDLSEVHQSSAMEKAHQEMRTLIICSYQTLNDEFNSIYAARCYGSSKMQEAFNQAVNIGFFDISQASVVIPIRLPLNLKEEEMELLRMKKLLLPDRAILKELCSIHNESTAAAASKNLLLHIETLHSLITPNEHRFRPHHGDSEEYRNNDATIIQLLWQMRSEYIRLVSITQIESAIMGQLCNELDELYLSLEESHNLTFHVVFDNSFLSDMDEAYRQSKSNNH